ncbi:hypothetical protein LPJ59_005741, partial [Coemansia sp. RSA 2399]
MPVQLSAAAPPPISFATVAKRGTNRSGGPRPKETRHPPLKTKITYYSMLHLTGENGAEGDVNLRLPPREIITGTSKNSVIINALGYKSGEEALAAVKEICVPAMMDINSRANQMLLSFNSAKDADFLLNHPPELEGVKVKALRPISRTARMAIVNIHVYSDILSIRELIQQLEKQLAPWGTLCDICLGTCCGVPTRNMSAILDLGESEARLPARLVSEGIISNLYGRMVTQYCTYCKKDGHSIKSCEQLKAKKIVDKYNAKARPMVAENLRTNEAGGPPTNPPKSRVIKTTSTKRSHVTGDEGSSSGLEKPKQSQSNLAIQKPKGAAASAQGFNFDTQTVPKNAAVEGTHNPTVVTATQAESQTAIDLVQTGQSDKGKEIDYFENTPVPVPEPVEDRPEAPKVVTSPASMEAMPETAPAADPTPKGRRTPYTRSKKAAKERANKEIVEKERAETE